MKVILVVGDGMGDRPIRELAMKTPLQAANTPSLDKVARKGICGIMDPISPGVPAGSDTAHLALFGYNPYKYYFGRGPFEALGAGLDVAPNDVAFRCNFATVNEDMLILDRRAGRKIELADNLAEALNCLTINSFPDILVNFKHTTEHRCALVLKGPGLSRMISDSDPNQNDAHILPIVPLDDTIEAARTANVTNELTSIFCKILDGHPLNEIKRKKGAQVANAILLRGAGTLSKEIKTLNEQYGISAAVIGVNALVLGVCKAVGMQHLKVDGATGTVETDVKAKAKKAIEAIDRFDFVYVHVKGTDNPSHDGDFEQKILSIEKVDDLVGHLLDNVDSRESLIVVTADHSTPVKLREHSGDPVPLAISGEGVRTDNISRFSEIDCSLGGLGRIRGIDLIPILIDLMGKSKKYGS
jgi:2,3-bisphosphoglycerate-independent phosphoglycerate mutase